MLISKVPDEDGGKGEGPSHVDDNTHEYQTANELFEMMAKNQNFNSSDGDTLTPRDLVLLYKNIDLGTKLMSNAKDVSCVKPNQHVETVIYHDDLESDGSDVSDMYSNEDLHNVYLVNKERLDLLNIPSSVEDTLCHKLGDLEIQTSGNLEYNKQFLFQDPFIKEQLKNFNLFSNSKEVEATVLPASLLDYVCCKRLEDNYNFYMDNIIRYVKNTIDQLKRISNGDYLTEKAKEKWKEVENIDDTTNANTKLLATSTSIPLHVECKIGHQASMWDDLVRSEVDVRSLSKILEKKIIVEVPKCISGSYKLLSKCCDDNLIISCKKEQASEEVKDESRVDVVFKLKRSETGHVVSNISSIMILQTAPLPQVLPEPTPADAPLALLYKEVKEEKNDCQEDNKSKQSVKITELDVSFESVEPKDDTDTMLQDTCEVSEDYEDLEVGDIEDNCDNNLESFSNENRRRVSFSNQLDFGVSAESNYMLSNNVDAIEVHAPKEASFELSPADLRLTMQKLTIQSALPEENVEDVSQSQNVKNKSPTRVRIKSPYENKSHAIEEKKRKKLLEIREKREKKKIALAESCKNNKNKFGNRIPMPQASSSVTKLSITNKSFYNSIYGQTAEIDSKQQKNRNHRGEQKEKELLDVALDNVENEEETPKTHDQNNKKFINRSYYLDEAVTEMMYLNMKQKEEEKEVGSASTSVVSGEFRTNLSLLSQLISRNEANISGDDNDEKAPVEQSEDERVEKTSMEQSDNEMNQENITNESSVSTLNIMQPNEPNEVPKSERDKRDQKVDKSNPSIECRKSIDKIYKLMNKMGKRTDSDNKSQTNPSVSNRTNGTGDKCSTSIQGSDSGTSLKHHLTSSNPSTFSFDRNNNPENSGAFVANESPINVTPKVIISSKSPMPAPKTEGNKRDRRNRVISPKVQDGGNPLKAISQLLHEFENVQRNRLKSGKEQKAVKKNDTNTTTVNDGRTSSWQGSYKRRSRIEQHNETMERNNRIGTPKERKSNQKGNGVDALKIPYQQVPTDDRYMDKPTKKKITDIIDEAKEARGEAVRGPSKFTSRLNSLAQPKKSYVQAHSVEYQHRYGRNIITDRLQRLAAAPTPAIPERTTAPNNLKNRVKRHGNDAVSAVSLKLPFQSNLPIERPSRHRHSTSNSPETKERVSTIIGMSHKQYNAEPPETLKKMVAVESYMKNHYGRVSTTAATEPQKLRAPLFPTDIDMGSVSSSPSPKESTEVGTKLHHIIEFMLKNPSCGLEVLDEGHESKSSKENTIDLSLSMFRFEEGLSMDSDFATGYADEEVVLKSDDNNEQFLSTDADKVKHALCSTISVGSFSKSLRMKNLRLTPRSSIQPMFLLQAGDSGSLVLNASLPQTLDRETLLDLKEMPILSKTKLNWSFTNIPVQITTVGYAFPEYKSIRSGTHSLTPLVEKVSKSSSQISSLVCLNPVDVKSAVHNKGVGKCSDKAHKDSQCYRGRQLQPVLEQDSVGDVLRENATPTELRANLVPDDKTKKDLHGDNLKSEVEENKTISVSDPTNVEDKCDCCLPSINSGVDNTTSFDILVGLLNEIKKITTCQTHLTSDEADDCKELEVILNKTAKTQNSSQSVTCSNLSLTNLDKLRCLESNPSVYSLYLSDNEVMERRNKIRINRDINPWYELKYNLSQNKPVYVDKETSVNIPRKEYVHTLTDVPSICFPITISHSTDVIDPLIGELCQTSTQSLFSYHSTYSDVFNKTMLEVPQSIGIQDFKVAVSCCKEYEKIAKPDNARSYKRKTRNCGRELVIKKNIKRSNMESCLRNSDHDPAMKMKRDILVTIYSMLVFTVFAALSFPEVLFHL